MKIFNKNLKRNKKSILSLALASVLALSFNYTPVSILANQIRKASAYESSTTQSYYSSSTTNEANMSAGSLPTSLLSYFTGSDKNFNIATYYNSRFNDIFGLEFCKFLNSTQVNGSQPNYSANVAKYLEYVGGYDDLYDYYTSNASEINTNLKITSFRDYAEYFVSHQTTWTDSSKNELSIPALFNIESDDFRTNFYKQFADFYDDKIVAVTPGDGLSDDSDFYEDSIAYNRLKDLFDAYIEKTVAIYTYDGKTQNKAVAGILANGAPTTSQYYYKDGAYTTETSPYYEYAQRDYDGDFRNIVYYFGKVDDLKGKKGYDTNVTPAYTKEYFSINDASLFEKDLMKFVPVQPGQFGYVDDDNNSANGTNLITYYRFDVDDNKKIPYNKTDGVYDIYVVDNSVTPDEQATYDSLHYNVISSKVIEDDKKNTFKNDQGFFVNIPYSPSLTDYFVTLSGYSLPSENTQTNRFTRYVDLFTTKSVVDGKTYYKSNIYLRLNDNPTKVVYLDISKDSGQTLAEFKKDNKNADYINNYKIETVNFDSEGIVKNDYLLIDSSFTGYYNSNYTLYFEKTKVWYEDLATKESDNVYDGTFETVSTPVVSYEQTEVPAQTYVTSGGNKVIYVASENTSEKIGETTYKGVSETELARVTNLYVKVPTSVSDALNDGLAEPFTFYYKHNEITTNKIYIVDDSKDAASNEVYKNLHYTVLTNEEYKANLAEYSVISSSDSNYNKNFKLYYKYKSDIDNKDLFIQDAVRGGNALYIIDDTFTTNDKTAYKLNNFVRITTEEFNANSEFYYQLTEDNEGYNSTYTKLYYKYKATAEYHNVIYVYSSKTSTEYKTFYNTDADYVASDYKLIEKGEPGYVEGSELYYKRNRTEKYVRNPINTYYSYTSTSTVSLKANQYYVVSFYVYTNGFYAEDLPVEASFYIKDTSKIIEDIKLEGISTNGTWQKYYAYIATDALATSAIQLSLYMGNEKSILGSQIANTSITSVTGTVLFDDIKVTLINETDYTKRAINDEKVQKTLMKNDAEEEIPNTYADQYNNKVLIANDDTHTSLTYDNKTRNTVSAWNSHTWNEMFNVDSLDSLFSSLVFANGSDGYSAYENLWQYYISRDVSGQGNNYILSQYQKAYANGKLVTSVIDEKDIWDLKQEEDEDKDEDKDEDSSEKPEDSNKKPGDSSSTTTPEKNDKKFAEETFKLNNKILKLENKDRILSLGVTSNTFTVNALDYYKLTVWVYSPDKDAKAIVTLNSVLNTASTPVYGSLLTSTATVDACLESYSKTPTNEYGWIPVSFYIEGNALHSQNVSLVLSADADSTVYFDNITIERISSSSYDTASSDSDSTTYVLSLTPSSSVITNGVTNGYFNNVNITNYKTVDTTLPKTAKNWTVETTNSTGVIAGVVPTNNEYTTLQNNFYKEHNVVNPLASSTLKTNVYAIHAPATVKNEYATAKAEYNRTSVYKIYSSSMKLSESSIYEISFEFYATNDFTGDLDANIYNGSVDTAKMVSSIHIENANITKNAWNRYTFYVQSSTIAPTIYLELGVENATGTCFFQKATSVKSTKTLNEIRDTLLGENKNNENNTTDIYQSLPNVRFVNIANSLGSVHSNTINQDNNLYDSKEYSSTLVNTKNYTVGQTGVVVASFYDDSTVEYTYTVTIDKTEYYIKEIAEESNGTTTYTYKLYSDSFHHEEVTSIDGKEFTVSKEKVVVGTGSDEAEYSVTSTKKIKYVYGFTNDYTVNNNFISADELTNNYSENVLILSNSYKTDYISVSPVYTNSLKTSSFYVLKIYVKTSEFAENYGLNINISSISTTWSNVDTTKVESENKDGNGFVCYQALITTNKSSISSLGVTFSLGTEANTNSGYAIIAGVELVPYSTEKLFNEYVAEIPDDDTTAKKYFGEKNPSSSKDSNKDDDASVGWATFFYIFSSLLLGIVLIMALVAIILKKHPIKKSKEQIENDHERTNDFAETTTKKSKTSSNGVIDVAKEIKTKSKPTENDDNHHNDEGFV